MRNRNFYGEDYMQIREERMKRFRHNRKRNKKVFGILMALVGIGFFLRALGVFPYFDLEFSWPIILIAIGVLIGLKNNFRNNAWWILILVGIANLTPQFMIMGKPSSHFVWPAFIVIVGLAIAFRPQRDYCAPMRGGRRGKIGTDTNITDESNLNMDITFGGRKEIITSKDFKGGVVSLTFGGCELNLTQADFTEPSVIIDCRVSFGGLEIIVPSNWEVQNEVSPSFGSVEDSRTIQTAVAPENKKVLILRGTCSFGSIELKSY
jgi:predicted membrane protein